MHKFFEVVCFALLATPVIWEIHNDKDGDDHISRGLIKIASKRLDVWTRIAIALLVSYINWLITGKNFIASVILSGAIHFLVFDYVIAYILGHTKDWFSYLGKKSVVDNWDLWAQQDPVSRLVLRVLVFAAAVAFYF